ncbi:MAG TPA: glutamate-1-semialdehyde 2,1-aminomutase [Candidatus Rubrimentiphilum sp.]|nr:glutamate-1-semialdehyde 2,1-aminomutase [Candidatus Rubrimentiphilum sp.]
MQNTLAGGCSSPVRSGWSVGESAFVQSRGDGAYAFDENGKRYIDYIMGYGPLFFGYNNPALIAGLDELAAGGVLFGSTHAGEERLARRLRWHVASMECVRFTTTGSEAVMSAIRVARAFTGRNLIVRFAGNYHGHFDAALFDAGASAQTQQTGRSGIPAGVMHDVSVARYNDLESVTHALRARESDLAAIIVEPVCANMGLVPARPDFLQRLRALADDAGALLIFDEIISWPRAGMGGAQGAYAIKPDITTIGKVLGGGFPVAAFGGRADVMDVLAPDGPVFTGGTHAGNPFSIAVAHRVLDELEAHPEHFTRLRALAERLASGMREIFARRQLMYNVVQFESIVDFMFRYGPPVRNYDEARESNRERYAVYYRAMLERRILLPPSQNEVMFLSTAHTEADVDETLSAIDESLA